MLKMLNVLILIYISKLFDDLDVVRIDTMYVGAKAKTSHLFNKI
jgi:hypothetical protein